MKRKKILALTLAAAMSLALFSGCSRPSASSGGNDNPSANNTGSTSSEEPIVIKIGHTDSDTRSTHKWSVWLGEWLEDQNKLQAMTDSEFSERESILTDEE